VVRLRVLVTDAETRTSLAVVRALGTWAETWTVSKDRLGITAWSSYSKRHFVYPFSNETGLPLWVLELCKNYNIDVVITPHERSSLLLAKAKHLFIKEGIVLTTPPVKALAIVMDKALTIKAAQAVGVATPPSVVLNDVREAIFAAKDVGYPLVVKPRFSNYWTGSSFIKTSGVSYANTDQQLLSALENQPKELPPPILQKFIPGRGLGIFLLLDKEGRLCAEFAHERLRDLRPTGSGSVLRRSIPVDPHLRKMSLALLRHIGWTGVAMVEFRTNNQNGAVNLMEINGRFWGSLQLATDAGVNFPSLLVDIALGKAVKFPSYSQGIVVRWRLGDLMRSLRVLKGKPAGFTGDFPARFSGLVDFLGPQPPGTRSEVLRRDDPWPAFGEIFSSLRNVL